MKLHKKINLIFIAVQILVLFTVASIIYHDSANLIRSEIHQKTIKSNDDVFSSLKKKTHKVKGDVQIITDMIKSSYEPEEILMRAQKRFSEYSNFVVTDKVGRIIDVTPYMEIFDGKDISGEVYWQIAKENSGPYLSDFTRTIFGYEGIAISHPITFEYGLDEIGFAGVFVLYMSDDFLFAEIRKPTINNGISIVTDSKGNLLSHFDDLQNQNKFPLSVNELQSMITSSQKYKPNRIQFNGDEYLYSVDSFNDEGLDWKLISLTPTKFAFSEIISMRNKVMLTLFVGIILSAVIIYFFLERCFISLSILVDKCKQLGKGELDVNVEVVEKNELGILAKTFNEMVQNLKISKKQEEERLVLLTTSQTARQVAHDIRSPLAALNVVARHLKDLPEDQRLLIRSAVQRIEDIANDLAGKRRQDEKDAEDKNISKVQLLSSLIEPLISEKRLQFRSTGGINIESDLDKESYGLFAQIQPVEFKRVLSNLINNSVEALGENGLVKVSLTSDDGDVKIIISDNGKGIPENILPKLMQKGASFGKENNKESGSGLGLYHARESVESWGGKIGIQSEVGKGTQVTVRLPKAPSPDWFVPEIVVTEDMRVVVLDDDNSIHQVWQGRFDALNFDKNRILHFTTPRAIISWYRENKDENESCLFLCDYELLGNKESGLDVIEQLGISNSSILVTSRFEEELVKENCERLGVKLLPKNLAGFVPIKLVLHTVIASPEGARQSNGHDAEYVLIDDTHIVRNTWELSAKIAGKKVVTYSCVDEFMKDSEAISKDTSIYIDSDLGDGNRGEVLSEQIYNKGFKKIFLATGFGKNDFKNIPWITAVVDKDPPFLRR